MQKAGLIEAVYIFVSFFRLNFSFKAGGTAVSEHGHMFCGLSYLTVDYGVFPAFNLIMENDFSPSTNGYRETNRHGGQWPLPLSSELTKNLQKSFVKMPEASF